MLSITAGITELDIGRLYDGVVVLPDGSKMNVGTGAGVHILVTSIRLWYRLLDNCSVLGYVSEGAEITLYVESHAALKALVGLYVESRLVCKKAIHLLT